MYPSDFFLSTRRTGTLHVRVPACRVLSHFQIVRRPTHRHSTLDTDNEARHRTSHLKELKIYLTQHERFGTNILNKMPMNSNDDNDDNRRSISEQEQVDRDDDDDNNNDDDHLCSDSHPQQVEEPQISTTTETTCTNNSPPSNQSDAAVCHAVNNSSSSTLNKNEYSNDTHMTTKVASKETKSIQSLQEEEIVETSPMDSELSLQPSGTEPCTGSAEHETKDDDDDEHSETSSKNTTTVTSSTAVVHPIDVPSPMAVTADASSSSSVTNDERVPNSDDTSLYVNHGLVAWEINRQRWLSQPPRPHTVEECDPDGRQPQQRNTNPRHAQPINVDDIIDAIFTSHKTMLLSTSQPQSSPQNSNPNSDTHNTATNNNSTTTTTLTSSNMTAPFPYSVPLPQLIDILQDLWEAESL